MPQALHVAASITGLGQSLRGMRSILCPAAFSTAPFGQAHPHTPHATQRLALIACCCFGAFAAGHSDLQCVQIKQPSPETGRWFGTIASTGQRCVQSAQPQQSSVIVYAIKESSFPFKAIFLPIATNSMDAHGNPLLTKWYHTTLNHQ